MDPSIDVMEMSIQNWLHLRQSLTTHIFAYHFETKLRSKHRSQGSDGACDAVDISLETSWEIQGSPWSLWHVINHRLQSLQVGRTSDWSSELFSFVGQINMICSRRFFLGALLTGGASLSNTKQRNMVVSCIAMYEHRCNKTAKMRSLTVYLL